LVINLANDVVFDDSKKDQVTSAFSNQQDIFHNKESAFITEKAKKKPDQVILIDEEKLKMIQEEQYWH
jgi:hypothetical protein